MYVLTFPYHQVFGKFTCDGVKTVKIGNQAEHVLLPLTKDSLSLICCGISSMERLIRSAACSHQNNYCRPAESLCRFSVMSTFYLYISVAWALWLGYVCVTGLFGSGNVRYGMTMYRGYDILP